MNNFIYREKKQNFWHCTEKRIVSIDYLLTSYNADTKLTVYNQKNQDITDYVLKVVGKQLNVNTCEFCGKMFRINKGSMDMDNTVCGGCNTEVLKPLELPKQKKRKCRTCGVKLNPDRYFNCTVCHTRSDPKWDFDIPESTISRQSNERMEVRQTPQLTKEQKERIKKIKLVRFDFFLGKPVDLLTSKQVDKQAVKK